MCSMGWNKLDQNRKGKEVSTLSVRTSKRGDGSSGREIDFGAEGCEFKYQWEIDFFLFLL